MIHATSIISPKAKIHPSAIIGPFCIVEENVSIGANCILDSHVVIKKNSVLADEVHAHSFAVIGDLPQTFVFDESLNSGVKIGEKTKIREGVTIHRSTQQDGYTKVGKECFLMANSHVAHDCVLGDFVRLTNGVLLGGHVTIGDHANLGGNAVVHQNLNLGEGVMIAGRAALNLDIPPFLLVSEHNRIHGLNLIGLKRRGFALSDISELKAAYRDILCKPGNPYQHAIDFQNNNAPSSIPAQIFVKFFEKKGHKGVVHANCVQHAE